MRFIEGGRECLSEKTTQGPTLRTPEPEFPEKLEKKGERFPQWGGSNDRLRPFNITGNIKPPICRQEGLLGGRQPSGRKEQPLLFYYSFFPFRWSSIFSLFSGSRGTVGLTEFLPG